MKYFYMAVQVEENGKFYAYTIKVSESDNVLSKLKIKGLKFVNLCGTKKRAKELVSAWNVAFKDNGTYMFDSYPF